MISLPAIVPIMLSAPVPQGLIGHRNEGSASKRKRTARSARTRSDRTLLAFALKASPSEAGAIENFGSFEASTGWAENPIDVCPPEWIMSVRLTLLKSSLSRAF